MFKLDRETTALVVIDIQERLVPAMDPAAYAEMEKNVINLVKGFKLMELPVMLTQQYTKGLGETMPAIRELAGAGHLEKVTFSCCGEESFAETLRGKGIKTVVVAGMETHICVLQTVIDLLEDDFVVHIVADGVLSRKEYAKETALSYMEGAGAVRTVTETVLFQLLGRAGTPEFKEISKLIK